MTDLMLGKDRNEWIVVNTPIRIRCNGPKDWVVFIKDDERLIGPSTINVTARSKEEAKTAAAQYIREKLAP